MLHALWYGGIEALRVASAARLVRRAGVILCYHNVVPDGEAARPGVGGLHMSRSRFERQLRWLMRHYEIVPLREFVDRLELGRPLRRLAAITLDDGYRGVFHHALPVLTMLRVPATVFIVADAAGSSKPFWWDHPDLPPQAAGLERRRLLEVLRGDCGAVGEALGLRSDAAVPSCFQAADWATIAAAAGQGVAMGVHSATHRSLPFLTDEEVWHEVVRSREIVERRLGVQPDFFAYPYGLWNERVRAAVRAAGYRAALTLDPGLNRAGADPWALRRINIPAGIGDAAFRAWAAGLNPRWAVSRWSDG